MFRPLECFIGLRYMRSRSGRGAVSFMSGASLIGIALGVTALIVILSIMNGLESETRDRLLSLTEHLKIESADGGLANWAELADRAAAVEGVEAVTPFVAIEGMLIVKDRNYLAKIRGIEPEIESRVQHLDSLMEDGSVSAIEGTERSMLLGRALAINLGVDVGDRVRLAYPVVEKGRPRLRFAQFSVGGVFSAGIAQHDTSLALINIRDASALEELGGLPQGIAVHLKDPLQVAAVRMRLEAELGDDGLVYSDWTDEHRTQFRAMRIEKTMIAILLMLVVAVAAFNIVASLMMVVTDKRKDIAILRTYGLEPRKVARIFLFQGSFIGAMGAGAGALLGLVLALNVESIVPWLESTFGFQIMPGDVYYVTAIPSEVHPFDVVAITLVAFLLAALATLYPARRAAAIAPAEALRSE